MSRSDTERREATPVFILYSFFFILYSLRRTTDGRPYNRGVEPPPPHVHRAPPPQICDLMGGVRGGLGGVEGRDHPNARSAQIVGSADTGFYSFFFLLYYLFFKTDDRWSPLLFTVLYRSASCSPRSLFAVRRPIPCIFSPYPSRSRRGRVCKGAKTAFPYSPACRLWS